MKFIQLRIDRVFKDSPDAGTPECLCSRCGKQIPEDDAPITRLFDDETNSELRYCQECMHGIDPQMTLQQYREELHRVTVRETGIPEKDVTFNEQGLKWWFESGVPPYYCFLETYNSL